MSDNSGIQKGAKPKKQFSKILILSLSFLMLVLASLGLVNRYSSKPLPFPLLKVLAHLGVADAQRAIGEMYLYGFGVDKAFNVYPINSVSINYPEAFKWFQLATRNGNLRGESRLALMYAGGKGIPANVAEAVRLWHDGADKGYSLAQYNLGVMYAKGEGVPQDYNEARKWYTKAAEQNQPLAEMQLGQIYDNGWGTKRDYSEAMKWYRKAAQQGVPGAQYLLGYMYDHANGVEQDNAQARDWYQKAAQNGEEAAQFNLGILYETGRGGAKDYEEAAKLYSAAAAQGVADAQFNLGVFYQLGRGVKKDYAVAMDWFQRAAAQGLWQAKYNIGMLYYTGSGVKTDYQEAAKWFREAAGDEWASDAQYALGLLYIKGRGVPQDYTAAAHFLQQAVDHGDKQAQKLLPEVNEIIKITPKDDAEAEVGGLDKAIEHGKAGEYKLIVYENLVFNKINDHMSAGGLNHSAFDVDCDYFNFIENQKKITRIWSDPDTFPETLLKQEATYNLTLALLPDFPYPHLCHVKDSPEATRAVEKILSRLGISRGEYDARRLAVENSSIFTASFFGHIDAIRKHIADLNQVDEFHLTALKYAYMGQQLDAFRFLLDHGANTGSNASLLHSKPALVGFQDNENLSTWLLLPIHYPSSRPFFDLLLQSKPKLDKQGMSFVVRYAEPDLLVKLLDLGAPLPRMLDTDFRRPQAFEIIKTLVSRGASIAKEENPSDFIGGPTQSLACAAIMAGRNEILKYLLEHGASPNGSANHIPLFCATEGIDLIQKGRNYEMGPPVPISLDTLAILLDAGADPTLKDRKGHHLLESLLNPNERAKVEKFLADRHIDLMALAAEKEKKIAATIRSMPIEDKARQCTLFKYSSYWYLDYVIPEQYPEDPKRFFSRNFDEAIRLCREAKEAGNADAIKYLPTLLQRKAEIIIDTRDTAHYPEAISLYREAAETGYRPAIRGLAGCYMSDRCGMKEDFKEAYFWQFLDNENQTYYFAATKLTPADIDVEQKRVAVWKNSHPKVHD
ncbi:MAG TPA: hypothetical protein VL625_03810 [Patescibacteria group bacterium]|nr:hypothetical protein [Patescibacteria group bacterium]